MIAACSLATAWNMASVAATVARQSRASGRDRGAAAMIRATGQSACQSASAKPVLQQRSVLKPTDIRRIETRYFQAFPRRKGREARASESRLWPVLRACAGCGDPCRVRAWISRANDNGSELGMKSVSMLIHAYARTGDVRGAERAFREIKRHNFTPNVHAFNGVMAACANDADMASALRWFQKILHACIVPDAVSFRTIISACARAGNLAVAEEWLSKMRAASHALDVIACSSIIGGYAAAGSAVKAEAWLDQMLGAGIRPGGHAFNPVVLAWAGPGQSPQRARAWLWKAMESQLNCSMLQGGMGICVRLGVYIYMYMCLSMCVVSK